MMTIFLIDGLFLKDNFFMTTNQKTYQPHNSVQVKMQPSTTHKSTCPLLSFGIAKSQVIIDNSNTDQVISSINLCISLIDDFDFSFIDHEFMVSSTEINISDITDISRTIYLSS